MWRIWFNGQFDPKPPMMGEAIPTNEQSDTDLSPRHSLQVRLQKEFP